jgi:hypothetical protein
LLVTGESNGAVFFTTRRTREDKYLRALEVRVATWVLLIGEKKWYRQIRLFSSRLKVLQVICGLLIPVYGDLGTV